MIPEREVGTFARRQATAPFLKGPVPLAWLARAAQLPGRALHVGVLLWFQHGMAGADRVRVRTSTLRSFGIDRYAEYRGLTALERDGLVRVERAPGRRPFVTILPGPGP